MFFRACDCGDDGVTVNRVAQRSDLVEKEPTGLSASELVTRTFLIFFFGGFILHYVVWMVYSVCDIIWIDFVHSNPHRSQLDALYLIAESPIFAFIALFFSVSQVITATLVAVISHRIWEHVPLYSLFVMVPVCSVLQPIAIFPTLNDILSMKYLKLHDIPKFFPVLLRELSIWVTCWWWSNRILKKKKT